MSGFGDQDGKSKTASSVDEEHYPSISKKDHEAPPAPFEPQAGDIAERAYYIWLEKGRPDESADENWMEAERELKTAALSLRLTQITHEKGGSVQS